MRLRVHKLPEKDVYRDLVRIPEVHRIDKRQRTIKEGRVCHLNVEAGSRFVVVRGVKGIDEHRCIDPCIHLDDVTRDHLNIEFDKVYDFFLTPRPWWGELLWAWSATEIASRISSRLAVLGAALGVLGLVAALPELAKLVTKVVSELRLLFKADT